MLERWLEKCEKLPARNWREYRIRKKMKARLDAIRKCI
jgi:hypothetical protein